MTLLELVRDMMKQNPSTQTSSRYLVLEIWRKQGLELYPHQREKVLEKVSSPESIARAYRKVLREIEREKPEPRHRTAKNRVPFKVLVSQQKRG